MIEARLRLIHSPNSLDRVFLAIDEAWRKCRLPGVDIWIHVECSGRVDRTGLQTAFAALRRRYPAIDSRLERAGLLAWPNWRIQDAPKNETPFPAFCNVADAEVDVEIERLFNSRMDWNQSQPFAIYVLSKSSGDDLILFRWPHSFADARGGVTLIEELARLYDECMDPAAIASVGDELRIDAGEFDRAAKATEEIDRSTSAPNDRPINRRNKRGKILQFGQSSATVASRMKLMVRRLSQQQAEQVQAAAMSVCGFARLADFVRACAIRALHEQDPIGRTQPNACYSTMHLIEGRKRRDPGPVCHNLFAAIPVFIPATIADSRRQIADKIQAAALEAARCDAARKRWRKLALLARVPLPVLSRIFAFNLENRSRLLPIGLANSPSMPLGFMGPLAKTRTSFCGAGLVNIFGVRPASYHAGYAINVNYAQGRMNIAAAYFEPRIASSAMERLLHHYVAALLEPNPNR